jgi:hypothetical protein
MEKSQVFCPFCGIANPKEAVFCIHCGKELASAFEQPVIPSKPLHSNEHSIPQKAADSPAASVRPFPETPSSTSTFENPMMKSNRRGWRGLFYVVSILGLIAIIVIVITSQSRSSANVNKFPPYQSKGMTQQTSPQAKQRYAVADLQLSKAFDAQKTAQNLHASNMGQGNINYSEANFSMAVETNNPVYQYYNAYTNDTDINAAVQEFKTGDIVINIYQFDRVDLGADGWQVVYGGTQQIANGDDFVMASDIGGVNNEEARIRYMLADMQLGSVADYYRQFLDQPAVAEAIRRWDAGVKVVNIEKFERKIVAQAGWKVVYAGTDTPIQGMDVILSTDTTNPAAAQPPAAPSTNYNNGFYEACPGAPGSQLSIGKKVQITGRFPTADTAGDIELYSTPSIKGQMTGNIVGGYNWTISDGPTCADNMVWWKLQDKQGNTGWAFEASTFMTASGCSYALVPEENNKFYDNGDCHDSSGQSAVQNPAPATQNFGACNNPYWPITQGSYWHFKDATTNTNLALQIKSITPRDEGALFEIGDSTMSYGFFCSGSAIYDENGIEVLPPPEQLYNNNKVEIPNTGAIYIVTGPKEIITPAGTFSDCFALEFGAENTDEPNYYAYCKGVGMVAYHGNLIDDYQVK